MDSQNKRGQAGDLGPLARVQDAVAAAAIFLASFHGCWITFGWTCVDCTCFLAMLRASEGVTLCAL